ncbi:hypothetical protein RclHR1_00780001 [Rhizophagus clarus]|uniref:Kinase-like domain-containing protein n=1 Tax=Rhizophagus clarus TaxID=94130 RepID=A0A2Z6S079_9GLOM|nr:hypothetical protein RclHR1_00780001 [Rhizophagus clarus]GES87383.1 kinase-like domain-containing protein [Rhizophagus clarus]
MNSSSSTYPGYNALVSYIREKTSRSFRGFLNLHRDVVVSSSYSKDWRELDRYWTTHFLEVSKELLDRATFVTLNEKINIERTRYAKDLQTYWVVVIEEHGKLKQNQENEEKENISLFCLIQGNALTDAFEIDIEKSKSVSKLKDIIKKKNAQTFANVDAKDIKLWKISKYFPDMPPEEHIHLIVKSPLLSLKEALSCIPPPITYSPKCIISKNTTKVNGVLPKKVLLWEDFFDEVNQFQFDQQPRYERPHFIQDKVVFNEEDVRVAIDVNICMVLNKLMAPGYNFSRRPTATPNIPDFNCYLVELLILVIEAKRKHVLEDIGDQTFPEFYKMNRKARMVIQQIYNYMGENQLRYGILTTYDNHWFLCREHTELWITKTLPLQSQFPSVLESYAYLIQQAKENHQSPHPLILVPAHGNTGSRILRSHSRLSSIRSINQQLTFSTLASSSNTPAIKKRKCTKK